MLRSAVKHSTVQYSADCRVYMFCNCYQPELRNPRCVGLHILSGSHQERSQSTQVAAVQQQCIAHHQQHSYSCYTHSQHRPIIGKRFPKLKSATHMVTKVKISNANSNRTFTVYQLKSPKRVVGQQVQFGRNTTTLRVILTVLFKNHTTIRACINLQMQRVGGSIDLFVFGKMRETDVPNIR